MRAARLAFLLVTAAAAAVACSFTFEPGGYAGNPTAAPPVPTVQLADGAVAPARATHLLVIAGEREFISGVPNETNDVWLGDIDSKGDIVRWSWLQPVLTRDHFNTLAVTADRVMVATHGSVRRVAFADFKEGIASAWGATQLPPLPFPDGHRQFFAGTSLVAVGGAGTEPLPDGGSASRMTDAIRVSELDPVDGGYKEPVDSPNRLPIGMRDMTVVTAGRFVYLIGGNSSNGVQGSKVHVGTIDPAPGIGAGGFVETTSMVDPTTNAPHAPAQPNACAGGGKLWVAGGSNSDVVIASAINETDGTLGPWQLQARLPGPLHEAGCVVYAGALHLIGGRGATSRSDRVMRAKFKEDGSLAEWEISAGEKLPAPRSDILAHVY